jgi:hypothetical protein
LAVRRCSRKRLARRPRNGHGHGAESLQRARRLHLMSDALVGGRRSLLNHSASRRAASKSASDLPASMTARSHPASAAAGINRLGSKIGMSNLLLCHRHQRRPGSSSLRPLQRLGERALSSSAARCRPRRSPLARRPGTRRRALAQAERLGTRRWSDGQRSDRWQRPFSNVARRCRPSPARSTTSKVVRRKLSTTTRVVQPVFGLSDFARQPFVLAGREFRVLVFGIGARQQTEPVA